jgi:CBS domain containing-hemolysin-like protein
MSQLGLLLIVVGVSLVASFLCSLTEACIYSVSRSRIETLRRSGLRRGAVLAHLRQHIEGSIAAVLIINTIANVVGGILAGALAANVYGSKWLGLFSGIFTVVILFFGEIIPKSLGVRFANSLPPALAIPIQVMVWLLWPAIQVCIALPRLWGKNVRIAHATEEDIISLTQIVENQGAIYPHEAQWVTNALRLNDVTAYDLMTPNPVVARVPVNMALRQAQINADHWRFSRLPVCDGNDPDKIVGVVRRGRVFDALARDEFDKTMGELMQKAVFVPENMPAHQLLDEFLKKRYHLFCVQNEAGQFTGVVTLEDVLECLLGREIVDETDLHEDMQELARRRKEALLAQGNKAPGEKKS